MGEVVGEQGALGWTMLGTFLRYHYEQGLSSRLWSIEEVFVPYLMDD